MTKDIGKQEIPDGNSLENNVSTVEDNSKNDGRTPIPSEQAMEASVSKKKVKLPKRKRTAVCLTCTNEWIANNGNEEKPSRCPVCGSRNLKWKEKETSSRVETTEKQEIPDEENVATEHVEKIMTLEDAEKLVPKFPMQAVIILVAGACVAAVCIFQQQPFDTVNCYIR